MIVEKGKRTKFYSTKRQKRFFVVQVVLACMQSLASQGARMSAVSSRIAYIHERIIPKPTSNREMKTTFSISEVPREALNLLQDMPGVIGCRTRRDGFSPKEQVWNAVCSIIPINCEGSWRMLMSSDGPLILIFKIFNGHV